MNTSDTYKVENELVVALQRGEREAFRLWVDEQQAMVLKTCYSFVHNKAQAQDITQEVFVEAYLSIHKFKPKARLSTWLYRIAVNKSLNHIRDNKKWSMIQRLEEQWLHKVDEDSIDQEVEDERFRMLYAQINALGKQQKIAFTLSQIDNFSYKEIAEIMALSVSAVESLIFRARRAVKKGIKQRLEEKK